MPNGCLVSGQCHCRRRMDKSPVSCSAGGTSSGQAWRRRRRALGGGRWPKLRCCWQASYGATFNARSVWNGTLCLYNWYAVTAWESSGNGGRDGGRRRRRRALSLSQPPLLVCSSEDESCLLCLSGPALAFGYAAQQAQEEAFFGLSPNTRE